MKPMKSRVLVRFAVVAGIALVASCAESPQSTSPVAAGGLVLADRVGPVDTSRLIAKFRNRGGGGVFIKLTAEPTNAALTALRSAGLRGRAGSPDLITFDSLKIRTVAGFLDAPAVRAIANLPWVERVESSEDIDVIVGHSSLPVNSYASDIKWNLNMIHAPEMWRDFDATGERQLSPTSWQSVGISVLDIGGDYRLSSPAANWQWFAGFSDGNYTTDGTEVYLGQHGTDVGNFAVGEPDNLWSSGVAPRSFVSFYKVLPSGDDWIPVVQGLNQAYANGNAVVNMSLGNCGGLPPQTLADAIGQFVNRVPADAANPGMGVNVVASAGNGYYGECGNTTAITYPAAYPSVLAVSAVGPDGTRSLYPNLSMGSKISVSAPGLCVDGLLVGGGDHPCISGTSFAAPHVAGAIAAIRALYPNWSASYVQSRLEATAVQVPGQTLPKDDRYGYGIINPYAVLSAASGLVVSISGSGTIKTAGGYNWTCSASGGAGGYTYQWERSDAGGGYYSVGSGTSYGSYTDASNAPYFDLRCTVTSGTQSLSTVKRVNVIIP